ncbi:MAG: dCMP deaminase family protein [Candidatus Aenigmarchaeota archaeon]|nr:dCMP deaminase family protein [Candidatus Aenigmarchaeota archaeon]
MINQRISKDEYYLQIARTVAQRSPCIRRQFGAIIVKDDVIVSTGYNGPARGVINCTEIGCLKDEMNLPHYSGYEHCPAVHSEENCILNAARHGANVLNGTMFICGQNFKDKSITESKPCERCKRAIINAGIREVLTMDKNGKITRYEVKDWVEEDSKTYIDKLREIKKLKK